MAGAKVASELLLHGGNDISPKVTTVCAYSLSQVLALQVLPLVLSSI